MTEPTIIRRSPIRAYREKPVQILAVQWQGGPEDADLVISWIMTGEHGASWTEAHDAYAGESGTYPAEPECIRINTLEGIMRAEPGDWIIQGVKGEFYPCKAAIFEATYEVVSA